jgi:hypothetical protein
MKSMSHEPLTTNQATNEDEDEDEDDGGDEDEDADKVKDEDEDREEAGKKREGENPQMESATFMNPRNLP